MVSDPPEVATYDSHGSVMVRMLINSYYVAARIAKRGCARVVVDLVWAIFASGAELFSAR